MPAWKDEIARAERSLARKHKKLVPLIKSAGPCDIRPRAAKNDFLALAESVVYQQLAGAAAATIWGRVVTALNDEITPEQILKTRNDKLRVAGLSAAKLSTLKGLSEACFDDAIQLSKIRKLPDEEIVEELTAVKGIGPWTANMFLMFQLGRLNVWPSSDYGVRNGFSLIYGYKEVISVKDLHSKGDAFDPYRSVVAWYCWRAVDMK